MSTLADYAARYIGRFNWVLTWSPPGEKGPRHEGWNTLEKAIRTTEERRALLENTPSPRHRCVCSATATSSV